MLMMRSVRISWARVVGICAILALFQPIRSVWMRLFFPRPWADSDLFHLYKTMTDKQNIRLDRAPMRRLQEFDVSKLDIRRPVIDLETIYPEYWSEYQKVQSQDEEHLDSKGREHAKLVTMFKPLLNASERNLLLSAFEVFHLACAQAGLTYFMTEASLMGVMRHHGLIPWDDDIDVAMSVKEWIRIRNVLGNIDGYELFPQQERHWKFYSTSGQHFAHEYHAFPYIDIFFYDEDDTHIWAVSYYLKHDLLFKKSDVFPLQIRHFEGFMVPVPCNLNVVVRQIHNVNTCVTPAFVHKTNVHNTNDKILIDCRRLNDFYPFVHETYEGHNGKLKEVLKVGRRMIHSKEVPNGC